MYRKFEEPANAFTSKRVVFVVVGGRGFGDHRTVIYCERVAC